mgnify:CR=1 FL=1
MKNRNKFDVMLDVIEAGDTGSLEQQNVRHLSQMKTLLDDHVQTQIFYVFSHTQYVDIFLMSSSKVSLFLARDFSFER